ncbi:MAG: ABC transporter permease [bacterium]|nr:ABC transporter permease [bacterium]
MADDNSNDRSHSAPGERAGRQDERTVPTTAALFGGGEERGAEQAAGRVARIMGTRPKLGNIQESLALILVLAGLIIFFAIKSEHFFTYANFVNMLQTMAPIGIIAMPATLLLVAGQVDLSVGSGAGIIGMMAAIAQTATDSTITTYGMGLGRNDAIFIAIATMVVVGGLNAFFVTGLGLNSIITTLGTLAVWRGLTKVFGEGQTVRMNEFSALGISRPLWDIPVGVFIFAGVVLLFVVLLRYTVYGRALYAIGSSPEAARLAGIRVRRYITYGFFLSGFMIGLAGLIRLSQVGSQSINTGLGWELQVLTAVILGGASLSGGSGTILGTVLALFVIGFLRNGLIQLNVQTFWIEVAQGALLLGAVTVDRIRVRLARADT